jgi:hypothetical protein
MYLQLIIIIIIVIIIIIINAHNFPIHQLPGFCNPHSVFTESVSCRLPSVAFQQTSFSRVREIAKSDY